MHSWKSCSALTCVSVNLVLTGGSVLAWITRTFVYIFKAKYRILHGKCACTVFTHELWRIRNRTSERSERVRFLIQNNECVNTVQSTFHVVLCLLYTYWDCCLARENETNQFSRGYSMQFVLFNEHFDVFVSQRQSSSKLIFLSQPAFLSFYWLTSNCPTNKLRDTGPVLSMLLNRTLTRHVSACHKFVQHTRFDFASRFIFSCVFLFSKVSTYSSPEDL